MLQGADVERVYADLAKEDPPVEALKAVEVVYHVAAAYRKQNIPEQTFYDVNTGGTERMLRAAEKAGVSRFVHCSTVGVLGDIKNPPATETSPYAPHDAYQKSKMEGECRALEYFKAGRLAGSVVRPGAIYGPGDTRFLKLFRGIDRGVFRMIGNGENYYHLVYIDDLVNGFILASERPEALGEVFIIAGSQPIKVKDLARLVVEVLGRDYRDRRVPLGPVMLAASAVEKVCRPLGIEPPIYPRRLDFFISSRYFDISKARNALGYEPQVDLRTGLARTAAWYRENHYLHSEQG
jgi:nucleoside-diphosphate-sugar epimerase